MSSAINSFKKNFRLPITGNFAGAGAGTGCVAVEGWLPCFLYNVLLFSSEIVFWNINKILLWLLLITPSRKRTNELRQLEIYLLNRGSFLVLTVEIYCQLDLTQITVGFSFALRELDWLQLNSSL